MHKVLLATAAVPALLHPAASAQDCNGGSLSGVVRDSTKAVVVGAAVQVDPDTATALTGPGGRFYLGCLEPGRHTVTVTYRDFLTAHLAIDAPHPAELNIKLTPSTEASITVTTEDGAPIGPQGGTNGLTVAGKQLQALADDPDDLLRQLQQLSAASGGSPGKATISVDGFQDSSTLPPKDSIAYINVSPDLFSAEYREPPFGGGRVEIYTKPGAKAYHGALFATNSSSWMNAKDPFTLSSGSLGKQRYGFDLSGPIRKKGSNFSLNLEHRTIAETIAVDALTPDVNGNPVATFDTVPIPQSLWEANARADFQLSPKDFAFIAYSVNTNHLQNVGVGGQTLRAAGYDMSQFDQVIRASNVTTISANLVHETRLSYEHYGQINLPSSTAPSIQVAGYFTGGGASTGNERDHRSRTEFDDDLILNTGKHAIKTGVQFFFIHRNSLVPSNFNGSYVFSGYSPTPGAYVNALQQYQQAQAGTATATEFSNVAGNPSLALSQVRFGAFFQDTIKLSQHWNAFVGLRYAFEVNPTALNGIAPRGGFSYTPDKKQTWVLSTHFGLFNDQYGADTEQELIREDGVQRVTSLVYNPSYGNPLVGATPIHAQRTTAPGLNLGTFVIGEFSVSKDLPKGFNLNAQEVQVRLLTAARTVNINQPLTPNPYGARPLTPNLNILQTRSDGTGQGSAEFVSISNQKLKHVQFFMGAVHINIRDNTDDGVFFQPQSAYSNAGEEVRRDDQPLWQIFGNVNVSLPYKLSFSSSSYANAGQPFNYLTGADNNGDGNFNDRPGYAPAGAAANGTTVFQTPLGLLTNAVTFVNGAPVNPIPRNTGALPWTFHLDANLQRAFKLTRNSKADHQQTLTANIRSANFLNHTNVTSEDNVLGTPQFLTPVSADTARRIEVGLRYSF